MALRTQQVPIRITGLDTGTDRRWVEPGGLVAAENIVVRKGGVLSKRHGFDPLPTVVGPDPADLHTLFKAGVRSVGVIGSGEISSTAFNVSAYDEDNGWSRYYTQPPADVTEVRDLEGSVSGQLLGTDELSYDSCTANGLTLVAWKVQPVAGVGNLSTTLSYAIYDRDGRKIEGVRDDEPGALLGNGPKCLAIGGRLYLFSISQRGGSTSTLRIHTWDTTGGVLGAISSVTRVLTPLIDDVRYFDVCYDGDGDRFWLVFETTTAGEIAFIELGNAAAPTVDSTGTDTMAASIGLRPFLTCAYSSDQNAVYVLVCPITGANAYFLVYDLGAMPSILYERTIAHPLGVGVSNGFISPLTDEEDCVLYLGGSSDFSAAVQVSKYDPVSDNNTALGHLYGGYLAARPEPAQDQGTAEVWRGFFRTTSAEGYQGLSLTRGIGVSAHFLDTSIGRGVPYRLPNVSWDSAGGFTFIVPDYVEFVQTNSSISYEFRFKRITGTVAPARPMPRAPFGHRSQLLGGGTAFYWDGSVLDILTPPVPCLVADVSYNPNGSINLTSGDSFLVAMQERWVSSDGFLHVGPVSNIRTYVTGSTDPTAGLEVDYIFAPRREVRDAFTTRRFFRTLKNETTLFFEASSNDRPYVLGISDGRLRDNPILDLNVLQPACLPAVDSISRVGDRYWCVAANRCRYSKILQPDVAPEFPRELVLQNMGDSEPVAVADMDGIPVVFTENEIFRIAGGGPDNLGAGGDFVAQRVNADVGCVNARSLASTPFGILFQSPRGFRLLDRSFQLARVQGREWGSEADQYAGAPVVRAVQRESEGEVLWFLSNAHTGSEPQVLVYNYEYDFWSTWTLPFTVKDAVLVDDTLYVLDTAGVVHAEQDDFLDDGSFVASAIEFTDLSFAGIEGFQRVRKVLLSYRSTGETSQINFKLARDDRASWQQTTTFQPSVPEDHEALECTVRADVQKCSRLRLRIENFEPSVAFADGSALDIVGIQLEVGVKRGAAKLNRTQR